MTTTVTVRRLSPGGFDVYGDPQSSTATTTTVVGCAVAPRQSTEPTERGRVGVIVGLTLYAPYDTDIRSGDLITVDSVIYEVEGEPGKWKHPVTNREAGIEVALRRAAG